MHVTKDNYLIYNGLKNAKKYIENYKNNLKFVKKTILKYL